MLRTASVHSILIYMLPLIGKLMQIVSLILLPASMLMELTAEMRAHSLSVMLLLLIFSIALFSVGRMLEGFGRARIDSL
ncbi:hypothetical protein Psta_2918 [Pirellula staleyi DSM 6068]|uniref:Uncharacterized protein n=1 Tax=Pirellula staleyi (strain ATCC 27377 / DSM 6068 / ICPB 4128) TaxID=530564 RepID=D2R8P2_PIRSD|nr:hypothetical protein Psta_2918 [Pirellula staleyi DSM 6068]